VSGGVLTPPEQVRLSDLEQVIARGVRSFIEVGEDNHNQRSTS